MLSDKQFRLKAKTLGIESIKGDRVPVYVPADAIVEVTSGPTVHDIRTVQVRWSGRVLVMFLEDLRARGEEIQG